MPVLKYIYVDGATYDLPGLNAVPETRQINNKELSSDVTLTYTDVGVESISTSEIDEILNN